MLNAHAWNQFKWTMETWKVFFELLENQVIDHVEILQDDTNDKHNI